VTVTLVSGYDSGPGRREPGGAFTITDPAAVATTAAVIDGLRQFPDSTYSYPTVVDSAVMLTSMQLTFRTAPAAQWSPGVQGASPCLGHHRRADRLAAR
jgi:hypothetical protein